MTAQTQPSNETTMTEQTQPSNDTISYLVAAVLDWVLEKENDLTAADSKKEDQE